MTNRNLSLIILTIVLSQLVGIIIGELHANKGRPSYEYGINIINDNTVTIHSIHRDTTYECTFEEIPLMVVNDNL
jgi:hypothetical protein